MALLLQPLEISSIARSGAPAPRSTPQIRSRKDVRISLCSAKDLEMVFLRLRSGSFDRVRWLYGHEVKESETAPFKAKVEEEEEKRDYYVNTGYAIRTLREEILELFYRELTFDIYRDDIIFKDPINAFAGVDNYKSILWGLRFHGRIFFRALWVDIVSVWQPVENTIMVRWVVHGIPRTPWETRSRFDGTSEYKLDKDGKIYEHKVDNIALNGPQNFKMLTVEQLIQSISCPSTPNPTYFKISSSSTTHTAVIILTPCF